MYIHTLMHDIATVVGYERALVLALVLVVTVESGGLHSLGYYVYDLCWGDIGSCHRCWYSYVMYYCCCDSSAAGGGRFGRWS